jgi:cytochrome b6-f complex iron-sulfur subunit
MSEQGEISRRAVLGGAAGLAGVTALTLAGCGTGATPDAASTEASTAAPSSSAASSTSPTAPDPTRSTSAHVQAPATTQHSTQPASTPHSAPHTTPHSAPHTTQPAARPSSSAAPPAGALAKLSAIPVGGSIAATHAGKPITLARPSAGTVAAFSAICTHMGCTVNPGGSKLNCPCHGSVYNAFTGQVLQGPAPRPLPSVAVHVADGYVVSG